MDSRPLCCPHSIAFAVTPIQNYPYSTYDDFGAAKLSAYLRRQNYMDRLAAVVVEPVAVANECENTNCVIVTHSKIMQIKKQKKKTKH